MPTPDPSRFAERRRTPRGDTTRAAHHDAIYALARASELHDQETGDHVLRIRRAVEMIALRLGFDPEDAEALGYDAMLHDVGKLFISTEILRHPDELTAEQRQVMQSHTIQGQRLLAERPTLQRAASIARSHHEAWDGSGYPDGLAGDDIPLPARITAAADRLDALLSTRPYKAAWSYEQAWAELQRLAGTALDPRIVEAVRECHEDGALRASVTGGE